MADKEEGKDVKDEVEKWLEEDIEIEKKGELPTPKVADSSPSFDKKDGPVEEPVPEEEPSDDNTRDEGKVVAGNAIAGAPPPDFSKPSREPTVTVLGPEKKDESEPEPVSDEDMPETKIFGLRTTANREDQVMSFVTSNAERKGINIFSVIRPHGMRGYIFVEAPTRSDAEQAAYGIPYARGILPNEIEYKEIEHMLEQVKKDVNIRKGDIAEVISGPFKREKCKITRVDKMKEEVVVELLEAAVPIPITVKLDSVKVIRRDSDEE